MFFKKNIEAVFSCIVIVTLSSCFASDKKVVTGKLMGNQTNSNQEKTQIKLYSYPNCPYCKKVINYLKSINQLEKITVIDVTNSSTMQELKKLNNNNTQCPFLYDPERNIKMLESSDIIKYLSTRF